MRLGGEVERGSVEGRKGLSPQVLNEYVQKGNKTKGN